MRLPSTNPITLPFGSTDQPYSKDSPHRGTDFSYTPDGTIYAPASGIVTLVPNNGDDGNGVYMTAEGLSIGLLHTSKYLVTNHQTVVVGQPVAIMGDTGFAEGVHLHWAVKRGNDFIDPMSTIKKEDTDMSTQEATALVDEIWWEFLGRKIKQSEVDEYVPQLLAGKYKDVMSKVSQFDETVKYVSRLSPSNSDTTKDLVSDLEGVIAKYQ